jgi:5-dehydro-2-deoxygluconokinase
MTSWPVVFVLAMDHRWQLEEMAVTAGQPFERLRELKPLLFTAFGRVAGRRDDVGVLLDDAYASDQLEAASGTGVWLARALDVPRSRPVELMHGDELGQFLRSWPQDQIVKLIVYAHPSDPPRLAEEQWRRVHQAVEACAGSDRELLLELQPPDELSLAHGDMTDLVAQAYARGITPTWWKLPPIADGSEWQGVGDVVRRHDPTCHGLLILGQTADKAQLRAAFRAAAREPLCRGFAVGRAIFGVGAAGWLAGELPDEGLVDEVEQRFQEMIATWEEERQ